MLYEVSFKHIQRYIFHKDGNFNPEGLIIDNTKEVNVLPPISTLVGTYASILFKKNIKNEEEIKIIDKKDPWVHKIKSLKTILKLEENHKIYGTLLKSRVENKDYYYVYLGDNIFLEIDTLKQIMSLLFKDIVNNDNQDPVIELIKSFLYTYRKKPKITDLIKDLLIYITYSSKKGKLNKYIENISKKIILAIPLPKLGIKLEEDIKLVKDKHLYFTKEVEYESLYNLVFKEKIKHENYFSIFIDIDEYTNKKTDEIAEELCHLGAEGKISEICVKNTELSFSLVKVDDIIESKMTDESVIGFNSLIHLPLNNYIQIFISTSHILLEYKGSKNTVFVNDILNNLMVKNTNKKLFDKYIVWGNLSLFSSYNLALNKKTQPIICLEPGAIIFEK